MKEARFHDKIDTNLLIYRKGYVISMKTLKTFLKINLLGFITIFVLLLIGNLIPQKFVAREIELAAIQLTDEGLYPYTYSGSGTGFYDNYTDAISLNILLMQGNKPLLESMIGNYYVETHNTESVIDALNNAVYKNYPEERIKPYSNFWLTGLNIFKILLILLTLGEIRHLITILVIALSAILLFYLYRNEGIRTALSFAITLGIFETIYICGNMAAFFDIFFMLTFCIFIQRNRVRLVNHRAARFLLFYAYGFMTFGIGYVYAPMMGLGMCVVNLALIDHADGKNNRTLIKHSLAEILSWFIGYGVCGISKQIVARIVLGEQLGSSKIAYWTNSGDSNRFGAFLYPMKSIFMTRSMFAFVLALILVIIVLLAAQKLHAVFPQDSFPGVLSVILVSFIPAFIWHTALASAVGHGFYTQNYFPLVFAILCGIFQFFKNQSMD